MDCPDLGRRYHLFSEEWHKPICEWRDKHADHPRVALFAPRFSYKSTLEVAEILQDILKNPNVSIFLIHHKLDYAQELVAEVAWHLQKNQKYRLLLPSEHRPPTKGKWVNLSNGGQFRLPGSTQRHATLSGTSVGQDFTSTHPDIVYLDDVISEKTIENQGGVAGVRAWIQRTLTALVGATGQIRVKGTMWSIDDWYHDIMKPGSGYVHQKRAILENDGVPDWKGEVIPIWVPDKSKKDNRRRLSKNDVDRYQREMKGHFAGQMMNDPQPEGSRPWSGACEHLVTVKQVRKYIQKTAVLMDPAPLGMDAEGKAMSKDGEKDFWAICVVGYARTPDRTVRVLLDGDMSQTWDFDAGLRVARGLMKKWNARLIGIEEPIGAGKVCGLYGRRLKEMFKKGGFINKGFARPVTFKSTQKGKATRIFDLASIAKNGDLFINTDENMNPYFLELFLEQARNWAGKGSIKHDDLIDAVAYLDDPAIIENLAIGHPIVDRLFEESRPTGPSQPYIASRYCRAG